MISRQIAPLKAIEFKSVANSNVPWGAGLRVYTGYGRSSIAQFKVMQAICNQKLKVSVLFSTSVRKFLRIVLRCDVALYAIKLHQPLIHFRADSLGVNPYGANSTIDVTIGFLHTGDV